MIKSRGAPNRCRRGPLSFVAMMPPIVARWPRGASSGSHWRSRRRTSFTASSDAPAGAVATRSPATWSIPPSSFAIEMRVSEGGGVNLLPEPRTTTDKLSLLAACSAAATAAASVGSRTCGRIRSAPLRESGSFDRMLTIGSGHFAAEARSGEDLAGIADAGRIERAAHELHRVEVGLGEHLRHVELLVDANAVFAGNCAAGFDAVHEDLGSYLLCVFGLSGNRRVVADQRMEIAVTGMKHIADAKSGSRFERADPA